MDNAQRADAGLCVPSPTGLAGFGAPSRSVWIGFPLSFLLNNDVGNQSHMPPCKVNVCHCAHGLMQE